MRNWTDADLLSILPKAENADFEFKSSLIGDGKLQSVLQKAASGFWNSGGGYFVAGVDEKTGQPDGGITTTVGRTARRDWIDRAISSVSPAFPNGYLIQEIQAAGAALNIGQGKAVYVVGFAASDLAPHMGDGCYYIRAGAHSDPASAFIVEALFARRGKRQPQLRLQFRRDLHFDDTLQLGVINIGSVPALDVVIEFEKPPFGVPAETNSGAIRRAHLVDRDSPLYLDYLRSGLHQTDSDKRLSNEPNRVTLRYKDPLLNCYEQEEVVSTKSTPSVSLFSGTEMDRMAWSLQHVVNALCRIEQKVKPPE